MKLKLNTLKIHITIFLIQWSVLGTASTLLQFQLKGAAFYFPQALLSLLLIFLICKRYKPTLGGINKDVCNITCGDIHIGSHELLKAFEVTSLEKIIFTMISPEYTFCSSLYSKGIILKTRYGSYLIDDCPLDFLEYKKVRRIKNKLYPLALFYLLLVLPLAAQIFWNPINIDLLFYSSISMLILIIGITRFFPPFYMSTVIPCEKLPLSQAELNEFSGITIVEGFVLSDKLAIIPFKKQTRLDGLAADVLFKKYIVLNPRLFALDSKDYLRFVLFHELCHIKHHDSLWVLIVTALLGFIEIMIYLLPLESSSLIFSGFLYHDYIVPGIATLYFLISIIRRKKIEYRADAYGLERIGDMGIKSVYSKLGYDLQKRL